MPVFKKNSPPRGSVRVRTQGHGSGQLGSGMRISASFQICALTAEGCRDWGGAIIREGELSGENRSEGNVQVKCPILALKIGGVCKNSTQLLMSTACTATL